MAISFLVQLLFIILVSPTNATHAQTRCLEHEKSLLLESRNQLVFNSSRSRYLMQWNRTDDCCSWEGVGCDNAGHVIRLQLGFESIAGGFNDSSSLFGLKFLEELDLSNNVLEESEIPREIHKLTHLTTLILSDCSLQGNFPEMIFQLPTLQYLDLSYNPSLSGTIPQIFPQNNSFRTIVLAHTNFSGSLPADAITSLHRVSRLDLSNCKFSGAIPFTLGNLTQLEVVDLSDNLFTGSISSIHFESLSKVVNMDLSYNSLTGTIPIFIFALPSLHKLHLHHNQFRQLTEFPIVNSSKLQSLYLSSNRLESPIPISFFNLQSLHNLYLSDNLFNDTSQLEMFLSIPNLTYLYLSSNDFLSLDASSNNSLVKESSLNVLDLSNNKIAGEIPSWIWEIGNGSLYYLNLSCNMLVDLQKPYNVPASFSLGILDLHSNQLRGEFPSSLLSGAQYVDLSNNYLDKLSNADLGNFSAPSLSYLSLKNNSLSGSFPSFICNTTSLQLLDLSVNYMSGSIPHCLFENIQVLNLGRNNISGRIPDNVSPNCYLISLELSNNKIVGEVPLSLANCRFLKVLNLSNNKLSGTLPISLTLLKLLVVLNLGRNNITGPIPTFTADCRLQYLVLDNNNLIGEIPLSLGNCKVLSVMNVGNNQIEDKFPCMLPSTLHVLELRSNRFYGEMRCHNKSWPNLQIIDIASNKFSGYLNHFNLSTLRGMMRDTVTRLTYKPLVFTDHYSYVIYGYPCYREEVTLIIKGEEQKLLKIWPDFTSIDLSSNNFHGHIPDSIGGLDALYLLNLSHNSLTGTIPKSFSNLTLLGALDLSVNRLIGKIPKEIAGLTFLQLMNVSHNKLVGQIPVSTQIQSFSPDSFEGNAGLCGLPLNITCYTNTRVSPPIQENVESKREIEWEYVFVAAGYVVGLGIFAWLLLFWPTFRYKCFEKIEDVIEKIFGFFRYRKRKHGGTRRVVRR